MIGSIIGDIIGSKFEFDNLKSKEFNLFSSDCRFTDDTVMTIAVYNAFKECNGDYSNLRERLVKNLKEFGRKYYHAGYGYRFKEWLRSDNNEPYYSYGNGSAMRVSGVVEFATSLEEAMEFAKVSSEVTHNHPEGIKGAVVTAGAIYLAKNKASKEEIKKFIEKYYSLDLDYNDLVKNYTFKVSCQESVPQALYCFLISSSYEDFIRTAISIGGDSDTLCAIGGSVAEYYYGIDKKIINTGLSYLDDYLRSVVGVKIKNV